jgi:hypothetical protein
MSDDTDLLFAAAATAALVTWMGTRNRAHARRKRDWAASIATLRAALRRTWHETPGYVFIKAIRDLLKRH